MAWHQRFSPEALYASYGPDDVDICYGFNFRNYEHYFKTEVFINARK